MRTLVTAVGLGLFLACGGRTPEPLQDAHRPIADAEIYQVLLDSLRPGTRQVYVERQFLRPSEPGDHPGDLSARVSKRGGIDSALVYQLLTARYAGSVDQHVRPTAGLVWMDTGHVVRHPAEASDQWRHLAFSRIAYSADSTRALVYASMWCGWLCGNASYYLLRRGEHRSWQVTTMVVHLIS
jgi:hypothetical protein